MTATTKPTGGPAFPKLDYSRQDESDGTIDHFCTDGMMLRDYFAAKAMQSIVSVLPIDAIVPANLARAAYVFADAMIAERSKL